MDKKCTTCGSEEVQPGKLQSTGRLYFRPGSSKFLGLRTANITVEGSICTNCGHIMLCGNVKKARALVGKKKSE